MHSQVVTQYRAVPTAEALIADLGHPHWPGWRVLILLAVAAQLAALLAGRDMIRPPRLPRAPIVRVVRAARD